MSNSQQPRKINPKAIKTPYGEALQIPTNKFLNTFVPPLDPSLARRLRNLKNVEEGIKPQLVAKNGRLWRFKERSPSALDPKQASSHVQGTVTRLMNAFSPGSKRRFRFANNKNAIRRSVESKNCAEDEEGCEREESEEEEYEEGEGGEEGDMVDGIGRQDVTMRDEIAQESQERGEDVIVARDETVLPDAYVATVNAPVDWSSIVVSGVYSHHSSVTTIRENIDEVTRCMALCMHMDARRRFTYGFTTEDEMMTLWFCDRRHIILSRPFNFISKYVYFFHFFLACLCADETAVGFDPTITLLRQDGAMQYEVTVRRADGEERHYRTIEELARRDVRDLLGRGTRVWKAVEVVDGEVAGEPVALKDAWIDDLRDREGDIDASIRASAAEDEDRDALNTTLLTVLNHGDVLIDDQPDRTRLLPANFQVRVPWQPWHQSCARPRSNQQTRYRIVYAEIGHSLYHESSAAVVFRALRVLHHHGWVHGDVSIGNILMYQGRARLSDLEYAHRIDEKRVHDRAGTYMFMPIEVEVQTYIFASPEQLLLPPDPEKIIRLGLQDKPDLHGLAARRVPFYYNPLHDLESLWWIAVNYLVTQILEGPLEDGHPEEDHPPETNSPANDDLEDPGTKSRSEELSEQRTLAWKWFWACNDRSDVMTNSVVFWNCLAVLPQPNQDSAFLLYTALAVLRGAYVAVEKDLTRMDFTSFDSVYDEFASQFHTISCQLSSFSLKPIPPYASSFC